MIAPSDAHISSNVPLRFHLPDRDTAPSPPANTQEEILTSIGDWIGRHPLLCVGAALTLGAALGCLIKRR